MRCVFFFGLLRFGFGLIVNETGVVPPKVMQHYHMTAQFGTQASDQSYNRTFPLMLIKPANGCRNIKNGDDLAGTIVLVLRGVCNYIDKALNVKKYGGLGMVLGNTVNDEPLIWMEGSGDIPFPCVFVTKHTYDSALTDIRNDVVGTVIVTISTIKNVPSPNMQNFPSLMRIITYLLIIFPFVWALLTIKHVCRRNMQASREQRVRKKLIRNIPEILFTKDLLDAHSDDTGGDLTRRGRLTNNNCPICMECFEEQTKIKMLQCEHGFHSECIDPWIVEQSDSCPICRQSVLEKLDTQHLQSCCCCCRCPLWRERNDEELGQPLLETEVEEENYLDVEASVVENPGAGELESNLDRDVSLHRVPQFQEADPVLNANEEDISEVYREVTFEVNVASYEDHRTKSAGGVPDIVKKIVKFEESKYDGRGFRSTDL